MHEGAHKEGMPPRKDERASEGVNATRELPGTPTQGEETERLADKREGKDDLLH